MQLTQDQEFQSELMVEAHAEIVAELLKSLPAEYETLRELVTR